jgi:hypothetical protein
LLVLLDLATRPPPEDATRNIAIAIRSNNTTTKYKIARITCDYDQTTSKQRFTLNNYLQVMLVGVL